MSLHRKPFENREDEQQQQQPQITSNQLTTHTRKTITPTRENGEEKVQIFLGGSCNPTTWRQTVAIPFLELNGITYYNPQIDNWTPEVVNVERHAKKNADWLLFVIDKQTRSTVSLIESAFMAGDGKRLVLVIYPFDYSIDHISIQSDTKQTTSNVTETREETRSTTSHTASSLHLQSTSSTKSSTSSRSMSSSSSNFAKGTIRVNGELLSLGEFHELRQARLILQSLVSSREIPIFADIPQALRYVSNSLLNFTDAEDKRTFVGQPLKISGAADMPFNQSSASSIDLSQLSMATEANYSNNDALKDIYLSLDDNGDSNLVSAVLPILKEKGLTFTYKPVSSITKLSGQKKPITASQEISLAINELRANNRYSVEESEHKIIQESRLALENELSAIRSSRVILIVITNKCRGLSIMVLASHFMALFRRNVVLCIQYLEEPCCINGETLTKNAIADYNRGRVYLGDYAIESQVPVFATIREAIDCCSEKCGHIEKPACI